MSKTPQRNAQASVQTRAPSADFSRRRFLLALGAGSAGAAAATAPIAAQVTDRAPEPDVAQGYRETDHVRTYYATARL